MIVGIHRLSMSTTAWALPLEDLARSSGVDPQKYLRGLGQKMMSVPTPAEDPITLGVDAALRILEENPQLRSEIDLLLWATESATDHAKAGAVFAHELLGLRPECRSMEMKQACYSGAFALRTAASFVQSSQARCALVIASDIARYERGTPAESSQGAAAVAMIVCQDPDLLILNPQVAFMTRDAWDFYRPIGYDAPIVDGKFSCTLYLRLLEKLWESVPHNTLAAVCCHTPIPRLAEKAVEHLKLPQLCPQRQEQALHYPRLIGNSYTAALFVSLCSLLDNTELCESSEPQNILCYSYGSGATAELFSLSTQPQSSHFLYRQHHRYLLEQRKKCSVEQYILWHETRHSTDALADFNLPGDRTRKSGIDKSHALYSLPQQRNAMTERTGHAPCLAEL